MYSTNIFYKTKNITMNRKHFVNNSALKADSARHSRANP